MNFSSSSFVIVLNFDLWSRSKTAFELNKSIWALTFISHRGTFFVYERIFLPFLLVLTVKLTFAAARPLPSALFCARKDTKALSGFQSQLEFVEMSIDSHFSWYKKGCTKKRKYRGLLLMLRILEYNGKIGCAVLNVGKNFLCFLKVSFYPLSTTKFHLLPFYSANEGDILQMDGGILQKKEQSCENLH